MMIALDNWNMLDELKTVLINLAHPTQKMTEILLLSVPCTCVVFSYRRKPTRTLLRLVCGSKHHHRNPTLAMTGPSRLKIYL